MDFEDRLGLLESETSVAKWSVHSVATRSLMLGTKDGEIGNPHAPISRGEGTSASWKIVWTDGSVSRFGDDRSALQTPFSPWLRDAKALAHEDPDAARVGVPSPVPDPLLTGDDVPAIVEGEDGPLKRWLSAVRARIDEGAARTWSGSVRAASSRSRVVSSEGLDVSSTSALLAWHVTFDGESACGRSWRTVAALADVEERLDRAIDTLRLLRIDAGVRGGREVPVLLHPDVVDSWVIPALLHNLSGRAVGRGESAYRIEQFRSRQLAFRDDLDVDIDSVRPYHPGSYRCTGEGVAADRVSLVRNGRLMTPILDLKYAARFGMRPTPGPLGVDSVVLSGHPQIPEQSAREAAQDGLIVCRVLGVHTLDLASGDFSLSSPQSLALGPSGPRGRARVTLSGNLFEALRDPFFCLVDVPGEPRPGILIRCVVAPR